MPDATIGFSDTEEGVVITLNFDRELPDDPEDASDAQIQAMIAFTSLAQMTQPESGEEEFDPEDWPEEAPSV